MRLTEQLLEPQPADRLGMDAVGGYAALKAHPFFQDPTFAWESLQAGEMAIPAPTPNPGDGATAGAAAAAAASVNPLPMDLLPADDDDDDDQQQEALGAAAGTDDTVLPSSPPAMQNMDGRAGGARKGRGTKRVGSEE